MQIADQPSLPENYYCSDFKMSTRTYLPYHEIDVELPPVVHRLRRDGRPDGDLVGRLDESTAVVVVAPRLLISISLRNARLVKLEA